MWGMEMVHGFSHAAWVPFVFFPVVFVVALLLSSWRSGWRLLALRFRAREPFRGESWGWQSARFRWRCNYGNCLKVGANQESLYLSIALPFRLFHPALLIPWQEIEVVTGKLIFGYYDTATLRLGSQERVRVRIYGKLVGRVRKAAGTGWPLHQMEQMEGQMKW
jgi:hypothetical protein